MNNETVEYHFKGTQGPWQYKETKAGKHKASDMNGFSIATTPGYGKEDEYNALLISASPLLLSALIKAVEEEDKRAKDYFLALPAYSTLEYVFPEWYTEAKSAIEAALNLKTVEK